MQSYETLMNFLFWPVCSSWSGFRESVILARREFGATSGAPSSVREFHLAYKESDQPLSLTWNQSPWLDPVLHVERTHLFPPRTIIMFFLYFQCLMIFSFSSCFIYRHKLTATFNNWKISNLCAILVECTFGFQGYHLKRIAS